MYALSMRAYHKYDAAQKAYNIPRTCITGARIYTVACNRSPAPQQRAAAQTPTPHQDAPQCMFIDLPTAAASVALVRVACRSSHCAYCAVCCWRVGGFCCCHFYTGLGFVWCVRVTLRLAVTFYARTRMCVLVRDHVHITCTQTDTHANTTTTRRLRCDRATTCGRRHTWRRKATAELCATGKGEKGVPLLLLLLLVACKTANQCENVYMISSVQETESTVRLWCKRVCGCFCSGYFRPIHLNQIVLRRAPA